MHRLVWLRGGVLRSTRHGDGPEGAGARVSARRAVLRGLRGEPPDGRVRERSRRPHVLRVQVDNRAVLRRVQRVPMLRAARRHRRVPGRVAAEQRHHPRAGAL